MTIFKKPLLATLILSLNIATATHCFEFRPWHWGVKAAVAAAVAGILTFGCWKLWCKKPSSEPDRKPACLQQAPSEHFNGEINTETAQKVPHGQQIPIDQRTLLLQEEIKAARIAQGLRNNPNCWHTEPTQDHLQLLLRAWLHAK